MTGAAEVPGPGDADGSGFFTAVVKGDKLCYVIAVLTESELAAIVVTPSDFYVNVHNATFPAGPIRGQLR